jgi:hypothetical protein
MSLLELFCEVDDFHNNFEDWVSAQQLTEHRQGKREPRGVLCASEMMTLMIHFHQSNYRDFKHS